MLSSLEDDDDDERISSSEESRPFRDRCYYEEETRRSGVFSLSFVAVLTVVNRRKKITAVNERQRESEREKEGKRER